MLSLSSRALFLAGAVVFGTATAEEPDISLVPSAQPTSLSNVNALAVSDNPAIQNSYAPAEFKHCYIPYEDIEWKLHSVYGAENCTETVNSETSKTIRCEYIEPDWYRLGATLEYFFDEDENGWYASYLDVVSTYKYGPSGMDYYYFDYSPDSCSYNSGFFSRPYGSPPTCSDAAGKFRIPRKKKGKRKRKGTKRVTCEDVKKLKWKKRKDLCEDNEKVSEHCPSVCEVFNEYSYDKECSCENNPYPFGRNRRFSCDKLEEMSSEDQSEKCGKDLFRYNCPSVCSYDCEPWF